MMTSFVDTAFEVAQIAMSLEFAVLIVGVCAGVVVAYWMRIWQEIELERVVRKQKDFRK